MRRRQRRGGKPPPTPENVLREKLKNQKHTEERKREGEIFNA